jgi:hypothetical protein
MLAYFLYRKIYIFYETQTDFSHNNSFNMIFFLQKQKKLLISRNVNIEESIGLVDNNS